MKKIMCKIKYEVVCDDGFRVQSDNKAEVAILAEWHFMMQHPEINMSPTYAMDKVTIVDGR